jgi:cell division septum initiation protein DivIVA
VTEPVGARRGARGGARVTEVVYRLYETVDELSTVIENARSVPMSGSCMVPRDHVLDLLDDLRESLPEDVQSAGAIVEQRTEILQAAQAEAELLTGRTRSEADALLAQARRQRDEVLGVARRQRDEILAQAQADADELIAEAEIEAARLVEDGRRHRDALVAEGQAEHERLVSETEVYQRALVQSDELGAQTQAEVAHMRAEVDDYVDTRLADFGSTLERMVRSVEAARSTLRAPGPSGTARFPRTGADRPAAGIG